MLELKLLPGQGIVVEKGGFCFADQGIKVKASINPNSEGVYKSIAQGISRKIAGESMWMQTLTNVTSKPAVAGVTPSFHGNIIPVFISGEADGIQELVVQRRSFLACTTGIEISFRVIKSPMASLFGGEGLSVCTLKGEGLVFIYGYGHCKAVSIADSTININTGSIVAYTEGLKFKAKPSGTIFDMALAGEGAFISSLVGTGIAFINQNDYRFFCDKTVREAPDAVQEVVKSMINKAARK
jgi:uncharacterized protein (AIM24 family)